MNIDPALQKAVQSRITSGYNKDGIIQELRASGYGPDEAEATYDAVAAEMNTPVDIPAPPSKSAATAAGTPAAKVTGSFFSRHVVGLMVTLVVLVILGGGVAFAALNDVSDWRGWIPFINQAPYDEVSLLPGIITHLDEQSRIDSAVDALFAIEPRTPGTPEAFEDELGALTMLAALAGAAIPEDASMQIGIQSSYDESNPDQPLLTAQGDMVIDFDVINVEMGGSLRGVGDEWYGRIDDFPALLQGELDGVPVGTWVQLPGPNDFEELYQSSSFESPNTFVPPPQLINTLPSNWQAWLRAVPEALAQIPDRTILGGQMASIASTLSESFAENTGYDESEQAAMIEAITRAWQAAPLTVFANEPVREELDDQAVYRYDINFTRARTLAFIEALRSELQAFPELQASLPDSAVISEVFPTEEDFTLFNELVDVIVRVRPDGSLYSMLYEVVVTSPDQDFPIQLHYRVSGEYSYPREPLDVTVPEDVHDQTVLEMIEEQQRAAQREAEESMRRLQLSSFRSRAEVYYNNNDFSYLGVCDEYFPAVTGGGGLSVATESVIECVDTATAFVAQDPTDDKTRSYCIDSTGFVARFIPYQPLTAETDRISCEASSLQES